MAKAEAEYKLLVERYKSLSAELSKEENVIIRHKPTRVAPIVIPVTSLQPVRLNVEPEPIIETPTRLAIEISHEPEASLRDKEPSSQNEFLGGSLNGVEIPPVVEIPSKFRKRALMRALIAHGRYLLEVPEVAPESPPQSGLLSSIYRGESTVTVSVPGFHRQ